MVYVFYVSTLADLRICYSTLYTVFRKKTHSCFVLYLAHNHVIITLPVAIQFNFYANGIPKSS